MLEVLTILLKWWAAGIVAIAVAFLAVYGLAHACHALRVFARKGRTVMLVVATLTSLYGGSKVFNLLPRFSSDDDLTVVQAEMNVATNETDYTWLNVKWIGPDTNTLVWVRDGVAERWQEFPLGDWNYVGRTFDGVTNTVEYFINPGVAASNVTAYAMYHLGSNLPPVEILDGDGISVISFGATSHQVSIQYGVNPAALGDILNYAVIEKAETDGIWSEMFRDVVMPSVTNNWTNTVVIAGFWVGRTTRWRARLEVVTP